MVKTESVTTIDLEIDGKKVTAYKDETILQVARRHGVYIPTMCYLSKLKPIASCRLCIVDIEGMEDPVLSCQERVVEGLKVTTQSKSLYDQRQNIMKLYDVNHPLQCGVCPKSGECDLQNKTMEFNVNEQDFSAQEHERPMEDWGNISYDPYLCILCERCVRVCNEIIGDDALQIKPGGYNSIIINTKKDDPNVDWGECAAVCPVGALSDRDFKYFTNSWELTKVPAACVHSSLANLIYYEVKRDEIYRVRNEYEFDTMAGVCRYGYDFENRGSNSDEDMQRAVAAFQKADTIKFNAIITNEEALILQKLKELHGYKLINEEARNYQKFLKAFASTRGKALYSGNAQSVLESDYIVIFGTRIASDIPGLKFKVNQASKKRSAEVIYMHPLEDDSIKTLVTQFVKYEAGTEESVLALFAKAFLEKERLPDDLASFFASLDEGYISAESNVGEEEIAKMLKKTRRKKSYTLIAGADLYAHPQAENIARLLGVIEKYSDFDVVIVPPSVNTLGVSLICDLDDEAGSYVIGYNEKADFVLSAIEDQGDVNMPALNQQEGTFTNLNKSVVPTNVAVGFDGFCLNDIANNLGLNKRYTIDYTPMLPTDKGYQAEAFDQLPCFFDNDGTEVRGYGLHETETACTGKLSEVEELESYDGTVVYVCNPNSQKNVFTNLCTHLPKDGEIRGSEQFATAAKIKDGDTIEIEVAGENIRKAFKLDKTLKGTIALMPVFDLGFAGEEISVKYRFNKAKIRQVNT
ncbi:MAG: ferredoxin [Sulfurospirillum sp.]|nr:MAG: ferredoxin [Sulfurospirillum sp.]